MFMLRAVVRTKSHMARSTKTGIISPVSPQFQTWQSSANHQHSVNYTPCLVCRGPELIWATCIFWNYCFHKHGCFLFVKRNSNSMLGIHLSYNINQKCTRNYNWDLGWVEVSRTFASGAQFKGVPKMSNWSEYFNKTFLKYKNQWWTKYWNI